MLWPGLGIQLKKRKQRSPEFRSENNAGYSIGQAIRKSTNLTEKNHTHTHTHTQILFAKTTPLNTFRVEKRAARAAVFNHTNGVGAATQ